MALAADAATLIKRHRQGQGFKRPNERHGINARRWNVMRMIAVEKDGVKPF